MTAAAEAEAAAGPKYCTMCGAGPGTLLAADLCVGCMDQDTVLAIVQAYHRQALALLREKDRANVIEALRAAQGRAEADLQAGQALLPDAQTSVRKAITAERDAQDRARDAAGYAAVCADTERKAHRDKAGPAEQTEALRTARAAADIAQREQAACEGASAAARSAEAALAGVRQRVSALEDAAAAARTTAENPPVLVPMSEWTAISAHPMLTLAQPDITDAGRTVVGIAVSAVANLCGLADQLRSEGRSKGREEAEDAASRRPVLVPAPGGGAAISPLARRLAPGSR